MASGEVKGSALPEDTSPTTDDYTFTIDETSGATKKVKWLNLANLFKALILPFVYPVNSIYIETSGDNPADTFGFGIWEAFAEGRALVGVAPSGTFAEVETEVGTETVTLTTSQMPSHSHGVTDPGHTHTANRDVAYTDASSRRTSSSGALQAFGYGDRTLLNNSTTGISIQSNGGGQSHNNIQPSITVYVWKRTA